MTKLQKQMICFLGHAWPATCFGTFRSCAYPGGSVFHFSCFILSGSEQASLSLNSFKDDV